MRLPYAVIHIMAIGLEESISVQANTCGAQQLLLNIILLIRY